MSDAILAIGRDTNDAKPVVVVRYDAAKDDVDAHVYTNHADPEFADMLIGGRDLLIGLVEQLTGGNP